MKTYMTTQQRILLMPDNTDISYAISEDSLVDTALIRSTDLATIADLPNTETATLAAAAYRHYKPAVTCGDLQTAAEDAAAAHAACLAAHIQPSATITHLYPTSSQRYALSSVDLIYAISADDPGTVDTSRICPDDLNKIMIIPDLDIANILQAAIDTTYHKPSNHNAAISPWANKVSWCGHDRHIVYIDGDTYRPLTAVIAEDTDPLVRKIHLNAIQRQLAICRMHLDLNAAAV